MSINAKNICFITPSRHIRLWKQKTVGRAYYTIPGLNGLSQQGLPTEPGA